MTDLVNSEERFTGAWPSICLTAKKAPVAVCGSCMDARGIADAELADGTRRSSMEELANWTQASDRVLVF